MSEQIQQIADRIRELREIYDLAAEELAKELNIPLETYLEYESGNSDIPVGFLYQIASRFNVEMTSLLTGEEPKLNIFCVVRKDKGIKVSRRKEYDYQNLANNFINKKAEPFLVTVSPDLPPDENGFNTHPGQEFNYMLEGRMKVTIDRYEIILNEGDALYFDSSRKHKMEALDNKKAKFISVII